MQILPESPLVAAPIETRFGVFIARFSEIGLAQLSFPHESQPIATCSIVSPQIRSWCNQTEEALQNALQNGSAQGFPPFDLRRGTEFQQRVWRALQTIKAGETMTYSGLAAAIYQPTAVRAVGSACGANPIPVLIPCHRVLAANRKIGGFSGGLQWKELLLEIEGQDGFVRLI
ncbi:MAG: methylated-DNA--[protein]-cysteine S-methyltransferase [Verrucomicrobia bacterium]|nr:methylated-DNA--[protein]-cysteine S-methyltransferase [Verrucomicrobiota bacterium]